MLKPKNVSLLPLFFIFLVWTWILHLSVFIGECLQCKSYCSFFVSEKCLNRTSTFIHLYIFITDSCWIRKVSIKHVSYGIVRQLSVYIDTKDEPHMIFFQVVFKYLSLIFLHFFRNFITSSPFGKLYDILIILFLKANI